MFVKVALSVFDCYTDFKVWMTLRDKGFEHPFLQLPPSWVTAWLVFAVLGTITAFFIVLNEISLLLDQCNLDLCCCLCTVFGCNFVTRSEALTLINIIVEDLPLLILTILLAASRYSCNDPVPSDTSSILKAVLLSSVASAGFVGWTFLRGMFRILIRCCRQRNHFHHSEKDEKLDANELYPREHNMGLCMAIHTILTLLFHVLTLILSFGTIVLAIVLLNHGRVGNLDPSKELNVYLKYPNDQVHDLTTTSAIIQTGSEEFCYNITSVQCTLLLKYDSEDHQLEFNLAPISKNKHESESGCADYLKDNDVFLGHDTGSEGVKKFKETCLASLLISKNRESVQRNPNLQILC